MQDIELVVFDLAGTTVHDDGQIREAFTAALAEEGVKPDAGQIRSVRGASKRQAILTLLPPGPDLKDRAARGYARFCDQLGQQYRAHGVRPVQGAQEVFAWCRGRGIHVALNTGFDREITNLVLSSLGWSKGVVDVKVCSDDVAQGRPAPYMIFRAMEATRVISVFRVANVGDTVADLQAGNNGGVRCNIGVLSGAHPREMLVLERHTDLLPSVADLPILWEQNE